MKNSIILMLFLLSTLSCKKDVDTGMENLVGSWIEPEYVDSLICFKKEIFFKDNSYRLTFKSDGSLIERKNSGDCATPPISYADYKGTWTVYNSIITIKVEYWGGLAKYQWKVVEIGDNKLKVIVKRSIYN